MLSVVELQNLDIKELNAELISSRQSLYKIKAAVTTKKQKDSHKLTLAKAHVARVLTLLNALRKENALLTSHSTVNKSVKSA